MHEWQYVHCFILDLCHYQDFFFKLMSCQLYYTSHYLQPCVPSCLSACPSKLCIRLGRGQANPQADILHSCCKSYFNSISTIESSDSSEQYWPGWCHLCGIWMDGAPSSVQWNSGGGPLVAPLLSGRRWCSTTKKQQRSLKTREEWRDGLSLSKLISFKLFFETFP